MQPVNKYRTLASYIAIALALSACSAPLKKSDPFTELVPTQWQQDLSGHALQTPLWSDFNDPHLTQLIQQVMAHNPSLEVAHTNFELAKLQLQESKANTGLGYNIGSTGSRSKSRGNQTENLFAIDGQASYEIDLWGRQKDLRNIARLGVESSYWNLNATRINLTAETSRLYYSLRVTDARIQLQQQALDYSRKQLDFIEARHRAGLLTGLDVNNQQISIQQFRSALADLKAQRRIDSQRLTILTGQAPQNFSLEENGNIPLPILNLAPATPAEALRLRPDIRATEAQLESRYLQFERARKAFFPSISLNANAGYTSTELSQLLRDQAFSWNISANIITTLLDNGARKRQTESARLLARQQISIYKEVILEALQDVESALTEQDAAERQLSIARQQLQNQERLTRETRARYGVGDVSAFDLVREQRALVAQQESLLLTRLRAVNASIALLQAMGVSPEITAEN